MNKTPDYPNYSLDELYDVYDHINRDKYPDRLQLVVDEIDRRIKIQTQDSHQQNDKLQGGDENTTFTGKKWSPLRMLLFHPPEYGDDTHLSIPWQLKDVMKWLLFTACFFGVPYLCSNSKYLIYRPWIAHPFVVATFLSLSVFMIICSVVVCRNHRLWRLTAIRSPWLLLKECMIGCKYLLVVFLIVAPFALLLGEGLGLPTESTRFLFLESAPSSIYTIVILCAMFTLVPVAEEWFFRGFLYSALRSRLSLPLAASAQALIFSLLHFENLYGSIVIFVLGIALAVLYERRKNLLSPILLHAIKNFMVAAPLLILTFMNFHVPAKTWEEAKIPPGWFNQLDEVQLQADGMRQLQYTIDKWGSKGSHQWKKETNGFVAVCKWHPDQRSACAKARLGIVSIYSNYLNDLRRAILQADDLISLYPDQKQQVAEALNLRGWAYYRLKDFRNARQSFEYVLATFSQEKTATKSAREGLMRLNTLDQG